jgi:outer membrane protein TolC
VSWYVAPTVSQPFFDRARIVARLAGAQAQQREALLAYRQRVLLALEDVENALAVVRHRQQSLAAQQQRSQHAVAAEGLARRRFEAGASDLLELLDAQRSAQQAQITLAASLTRQRQQIVSLMRAFGTVGRPAHTVAAAAPAV